MTQRVAVLGAGLMGHGIAYLFAQGGWQVHVQDPSADSRASLPERLARISALLRTDATALNERVSVHERIAEAVQGVQLVIEAAPEIVAIKQQIFEELERECRADALLASNTSVIPIQVISERMRRRERVLGAHFWNPPHLVRLVEVIMMGPENARAADDLMAILASLDMHPVLVRRDIPGFIGNRLQHALKREAIALVAAGVCDAQTIDEVVRFGFGARMAALGPLEQSDLVGLELTQQIHDILMPDLDVTDHCHPYLAELVARGELGMKTGKGFRNWTPAQAQEVRDRLSRFLAESAAVEAAKHETSK